MAWYKYFTVEIPLLVCTYCMILQIAILTNLYIYRTCYVILKYDESLCSQLGNVQNNVTDWLEPLVQPTVNHINMVHSVTSNLIPMVFCMFVGTWSDKFGRKPFLVLCLGGISLSTAMNTLIIHFSYASPWWFLISQIPSLLTGGFTTIMIVISAYLTDVTTEHDRVIRLGIFEVIFAFSSFFGNLTSSYLFYATSYETVFLLATGLSTFSFFYTIFFIPESLKSEKKKFSLQELLQSINITDLVKNTIRKRENNARTYILAIMGIQTIYMFVMGEMSVGSLFLRAKLHWTLEKITIVNSITSFANILGTLFGTYVLYKIFKIKELHLCLFGLVLISIGNVLKGIATNDYYIYAANAFNIFFGLPNLMLRTILSFIVAPEEMGKIFALSSIIMSLDNMLGSLLYPIVYNATINTNSGIYNFVSLGVHVLVGIIVLFLTRVKFPYYKPPQDKEQNEKPTNISKKLSITINNFEVLGINDDRRNRLSLDIMDTKRFSDSPSLF